MQVMTYTVLLYRLIIKAPIRRSVIPIIIIIESIVILRFFISQNIVGLIPVTIKTWSWLIKILPDVIQ